MCIFLVDTEWELEKTITLSCLIEKTKNILNLHLFLFTTFGVAIHKLHNQTHCKFCQCIDWGWSLLNLAFNCKRKKLWMAKDTFYNQYNSHEKCKLMIINQ